MRSGKAGEFRMLAGSEVHRSVASRARSEMAERRDRRISGIALATLSLLFITFTVLFFEPWKHSDSANYPYLAGMGITGIGSVYLLRRYTRALPPNNYQGEGGIALSPGREN